MSHSSCKFCGKPYFQGHQCPPKEAMSVDTAKPRYVLASPVKGGTQWWEITDTELNYTVATLSDKYCRNAEQEARALCDRLNGVNASMDEIDRLRKDAATDLILLNEISKHLPKEKRREPALDEHLKHVQKFLQEMYAIMIDPVEDATGTVADTCRLLLNAARRDRETIHHLRWITRKRKHE